MRHHQPLDDTTASGQLFLDMTEVEAPGYPDKMQVDQKGNLYYTGPAGPHPGNGFSKRSVDRSIVQCGLQRGTTPREQD